MALFDRLVLVTKPVELDALLGRFGSRNAVQYFLDSRGQKIEAYEREADRFRLGLESVRQALPPVPCATLTRADLPHFLWREKDLAIAMGPDGLVINVARYLGQQPILGINPNPDSIEGKLVRFAPVDLGRALEQVLAGRYESTSIATLDARLNDGRVLRAVNDFLVGRLDHVSARYRITIGSTTEHQSSSGVLVSSAMGTGAWLKSVVTGATRILEARMAPSATAEPGKLVIDQRLAGTIASAVALELPWEDRSIIYAVREPFPTRSTATGLAFGLLEPGLSVTIASDMPEAGVIVSDGVLEDFVPFNSGASVSIASSERSVRLITAVR